MQTIKRKIVLEQLITRWSSALGSLISAVDHTRIGIVVNK